MTTRPGTTAVPARSGAPHAGSGGGEPAVDSEAVAAATTRCRAVAGLSGGPLGAVATYLPGRRVAGVRVRTDTVSVHVVAAHGCTAAEVGDQVRAAVAPLAGGRAVDVVLEDIVVDDTAADDTARDTAASAAPTTGPTRRRSARGRPAGTEPSR